MYLLYSFVAQIISLSAEVKGSFSHNPSLGSALGCSSGACNLLQPRGPGASQIPAIIGPVWEGSKSF